MKSCKATLIQKTLCVFFKLRSNYQSCAARYSNRSSDSFKLRSNYQSCAARYSNRFSDSFKLRSNSSIVRSTILKSLQRFIQLRSNYQSCAARYSKTQRVFSINKIVIDFVDPPLLQKSSSYQPESSHCGRFPASHHCR